ncbi:hypothetical protein L1D32_01140 [Shewanella insulae]|uniref:hypothetical protein n=1 Tax=Shewanella insulae TaxID=2681496 RepID=UPI001EFD097B|nr:hypothetical protein [Shewanella insulae]MCG9736764.1 hypothetical protein [Shewanella insulae]
MLKRILAVSLALNFSVAAQAASPITLLSEQCIDYRVSLSQAKASDTQLDASVRLERELIGLFNLKDSVRFYRHYPLNRQDRESLLQCQLHLADEFDRLAQDAWLKAQSQQWAASESPGLHHLGQLLTQQIAEQISQEQKAKLHTAQASIAHGLKQKDLSLIIGQDQCRLPDERVDTQAQTRFDNSIASYLIHQQDETCKRLVWQAYQVRAKQKNQAALSLILETRQAIALEHGFRDYANWSLSHRQLAHPAQVKQYLDSQTQRGPSPWALGAVLAELPKVEVKALTGQALLEEIQSTLEPFGLKFETVNDKMLRLWHLGRLLGELFLAQGPRLQKNNARLSPLRQAVVGQQFGQLTLSLPDELDDYRSQELLISTMAEMVSRMIIGGRYYLNNTLGDDQAIARYWLSQYLTDSLLPKLPSNSREAQLKAFSIQLKVFRSKLALSAYQAPENRLYSDMSHEFALSFGKPWPHAKDAIYSFTGAATQGPLYYLPLWHQSLAREIHARARLDTRALFELLLINEQQLTLEERLTIIFGSAPSVATILERSQHDQPKPIH